VSDFLHAATLTHKAARPQKRGRLLRAFRLECFNAASLQRKGRAGVAAKTVERAKAKLLLQLFGRHGHARTWKHAHTIRMVLGRVQQQEFDEVFRSESTLY